MNRKNLYSPPIEQRLPESAGQYRQELRKSACRCASEQTEANRRIPSPALERGIPGSFRIHAEVYDFRNGKFRIRRFLRRTTLEFGIIRLLRATPSLPDFPGGNFCTVRSSGLRTTGEERNGLHETHCCNYHFFSFLLENEITF